MVPVKIILEKMITRIFLDCAGKKWSFDQSEGGLHTVYTRKRKKKKEKTKWNACTKLFVMNQVANELDEVSVSRGYLSLLLSL